MPHIKMNRFFLSSLSLLCMDITCSFDQFIWGVCACLNVTRHMRMFPISFVTGQAIIFFGVAYFFAFASSSVSSVWLQKQKKKKKMRRKTCIRCENRWAVYICQFIVVCCLATFDTVTAAAIAVTCHLLSTRLFRVHWWCAISIMGLLWLRLG